MPALQLSLWERQQLERKLAQAKASAAQANAALLVCLPGTAGTGQFSASQPGMHMWGKDVWEASRY